MRNDSSYRVYVQPSGLRFEQREDLSLLESALAQSVRLPHSCRNGACRACICRLRSGQVTYLIEWPGLTREEKKEGWILPCVAQARSDLVIDAPDAIALDK